MGGVRRLPLLTILLLLAVLPSTATAKLRPLPGTGETPAVAVDASGTALVAWYLHTDTGENVALCRIPRRARPCAAPQIIDATRGASSGVQPPLLRVSGAVVDLVAAGRGASGPRARSRARPGT
jgi:hypothetical protein